MLNRPLPADLPSSTGVEHRGNAVLPLHVSAPIWVALALASWAGVYLIATLIF